MIGKLTGTVDSRGEDTVLVDVNGVGYVVQCSARTLDGLPGPGGAITLWIETQMRDDSIKLFGFPSLAEQDWFRLLLTVQGVGAKVALAVLGTLGSQDLSAAIALQDKAAVARTPGVGPKVAQRIVTELRDKAPEHPALAVVAGQDAGGEAAPQAAVHDAVSALVNLGYPRLEAAGAVAAAAKSLDPDANAEDLIRVGLRELAQ